jgi:membrane protease YdiL (CAAX protease family)
MKRAIKLLLMYVAIQLVCQFVVSVIVFIPRMSEVMKAGKLSPTEITDILMGDGGQLVSITALTLLISGILMAWYLIRGKYVNFTVQSFKEVPAKALWMSLPFVIGALLTCNLITECMDLPDVVGDTFLTMSHNVWGFLSIAIMAPVVEELLFRGAIQGHMLRLGYSPRLALVISALLFGIMHFNPAQSFFAFMLGLAFGWLYYRTGSVVPGMIGHAINNTACALLMVFDAEHAQMSVQEQYGDTTFNITLIIAILCFVIGYVMLNKELPAAPRYVEEEAVEEETKEEAAE